VITPPAGARVLLASRPVDFRKGAHLLAALAAEVLGEDPFSGAVLVFRSGRADRVKILVWDGTSFGTTRCWRSWRASWKRGGSAARRWPARAR
jgi:transposase